MADTINLDTIIAENGINKKNWEFLMKDISNESYSEKIVASLLESITKEPQNLLNLDLVDYILDFGCQKIVSLIAEKKFLDSILYLTNGGEAIHKKAIYLIQKWAKKFSENKNLASFQEI